MPWRVGCRRWFPGRMPRLELSLAAITAWLYSLGRVVFGAEHRWEEGLGLGMQASWGLHRAQQLDDSVIRVSWRSGVEAAIVLSYQL